MSKDTASMTLEGDLATEAREAAKAAISEADGTTKEPAADENPGDESPSNEETSDEKPKGDDVDDKAPDSLEIKKPEETKSDSEGEGLDMETFYAEYAETGQLSDESKTTIVEALEKAGIKNGEALVQDYIAGREATETNMQNQAFSAIGGPDNFKAMSEWAVDNLSEAEIEAYNEATSSSKTALLAVRGLYSQYLEATGGTNESRQSPRVSSPPNSTAGLAPITSLQQIAALTSDPRMDTDPGYRAEVEARIAASRKAGHI